LGFCNNSLFNSIYSSVLAFKVVLYFLFRSLYKKVSIKRLILALVVVSVVDISNLVYINIVGLEGFYIEAFRQKLTVKI